MIVVNEWYVYFIIIQKSFNAINNGYTSGLIDCPLIISHFLVSSNGRASAFQPGDHWFKPAVGSYQRL